MDTTTRKKDFRVAVITVSDSRFAGENKDTSGEVLVELIQNSWNAPVEIFPSQQFPFSSPLETSSPGGCIWKMIVSDDYEHIRSAIKYFCDSKGPNADVIITTGGTGFAERDITPEATKSLLTKEAPGLVTAMINRSLYSTPFAALSRLAAGIRGRTLIVNFPGSVKAVKECWQVVERLVPHAVDLLREDAPAADLLHQSLAVGTDHSLKSSGPVSEKGRHHCHHHHDDNITQGSVSSGSISSRPRESPYPMITYDEAIKQVLEKASALPRRIISVDFMDALDHVLAEDITAPDPQPPFPASIKDGYAVVASDGAGERLVMSGASTAGIQELPVVRSGWCIRISTGAPIPQGADAVVQVEDTKLIEEKDGEEMRILILKAPAVGQDIRPIGCDVEENETVLTKGTILTSAEIGILASVGQTRVPVYQFPKVAILSTGDELVDSLSMTPRQSLPYGKIRDTNRPELIALLRQYGLDPKIIIDGGICPDEPSALLDTLSKLFDQVDIVVTSGGVSMGERDYVKDILVNQLGFELHFARVRMKPGKPTTFASSIWRNEKPVLFFGLPGNPVSAWVTATLYAVPAVRMIAGYDNPNFTVIIAQLSINYPLDPRPEFVRAGLVGPTEETGGSPMPTAVILEANQMSSRLVSNRRANSLIMMPGRSEDKETMRAGELVPAMVLLGGF